MARENGDTNISSNARNAGSELLWGEPARSPHESPLSHCGEGLVREKLFVDLDYPGLCPPIGTLGTSPP